MNLCKLIQFPSTLLLFIIFYQFVKQSDDSNNIDIGANPSAEEAEEGYESTSTSGINVVLQNRLVDYDMKKSEFKKHIKSFSKNLLERVGKENPERASFLKSNLPKAVLKFIENFDDYSLFIGESLNENGVIVLCKYAEECSIGSKVDVYVWKDAVVEEKCVSQFIVFPEAIGETFQRDLGRARHFSG